MNALLLIAEVSGATVVALTMVATGMVWIIRKLLRAGAWFAAVAANTAATQNLTSEIVQLRTMMQINTNDINETKQRVSELEKDRRSW
jgi:hypothetical protein